MKSYFGIFFTVLWVGTHFNGTEIIEKFHEQRRQSYGQLSLSTGLVDGLFSIKDTTKDMVICCFDIMIVYDYISLR